MKERIGYKEYVSNLYSLFLNREADAQGLDHYVSLLLENKKPIQTVNDITLSYEYTKINNGETKKNSKHVSIMSVLNTKDTSESYDKTVLNWTENVREEQRLISDELNKLRLAIESNKYQEKINSAEFYPLIDVDRENNRLHKINLLCNIVVIDGASGTTSALFRTYPLCEFLEKKGFKVGVYRPEEVIHFNEPWESLVAIILVRVAYTEIIQSFCNAAKSKNIKLICDFDDLVFRPELLHLIDGVRFLANDELKLYKNGMVLYKKTLLNSDFAFGSTNTLVQQELLYQKKSFHLENYPVCRVKISKSDIEERLTGKFTIGYYSGTKTHQKDFSVCADSLVTFLSRHEDAMLRIVGSLDLGEFEELWPYEKQILQINKILDYEAMIVDIKDHCDVVIAPLESNNLFCDSKSALKFFDAAGVAVPCIATDNDTFSSVIKHKVNGYLAKDNTDWLLFLEELYESRVKCILTGLEAFLTVESKYRKLAQTSRLDFLFQEIGLETPQLSIYRKENFLLHDADKKVDYSIVLPKIMPGSGGHDKAIKIAESLKQNGFRVKIHIIGQSQDEINGIIPLYTDMGAVSNLDIGKSSCVIATHWSTVWAINKFSNLDKKPIYFIQDYESSFYPVGFEYEMSRRSYFLNFDKFTLGKWVKNKILGLTGGQDIPSLGFPIDKEVYLQVRPFELRERIILCYYRPDQPRRLPEFLGQLSLMLVPYLEKDWKIVFFGSDVPIEKRVPGIEFLGKIVDKTELSYLYNRCSIGISLSATNPSLVDFEMLACGLPLVTLDFGHRDLDYNGCSGIYYIEIELAKAFRSLVELIENVNLRRELSHAAMNWSLSLPTIDDFKKSAFEIIRSYDS